MTVESAVFESLDAIAMALGGQPRWYQLTPGRFKASMRRVKVADIRVTGCEWGQSILMYTQTRREYCTLFTQTKSGVFYNFGKPLKRDILISSGRRNHVVRIPKDCRTLIVEIPMRLLVGKSPLTILKQPLPQNGALCASVERLELWQKLRDCYESLLLTHSEFDLKADLIEPFRAAIDSEPRLDELCASLIDRRATIKKAQEYIEDQFPNPITVAELANVLDQPERTIRFQFDEVYGMPPSQFNRLHRLTAAHRALESSNPVATTVAKIAHKCGFAHVSHFTKVYRTHFHRLPSHSLNQPPPDLVSNN